MITVRKVAATHAPESLVRVMHDQCLLASPNFSAVWKTLGGRQVVWIADDGTTIVAALAGVEFGMPPFQRFQSFPDGLPAFPLNMNTARASESGMSHIIDAMSHHGYLKCFIVDYNSELPPHSAFTRAKASTHVAGISGKGYEPNDKTLLSEIRKAEREGTTIIPFEWGRHGSRFIDLVALSETRHGRLPKYPARFFEALASAAQNDNRIVWTWCDHGGTPVASHIYFVLGSHAVNWQIYYDKDFSFLKSNQLTMWRTIAELRSRGVCWLNLGASPEEAEGLVAYKAKWNAVAHDYTIFEKKSLLGRLV